ncbi:MAG: UvrD-helicase domain-containing protein [Clostridia bacterium]|nr:UvrD-helicase domain-containing protein [Clostridia bacterium]
MLTPYEITTLRRQIIDRQFARMNPPQRQAVYHTDGPLLILAGAGSGKTTVLVNRIANLVRFGSGYVSDDVPLLTDAQEEKLRLCADGRIPLDGEIVSLLAVDPCPAWRILAITFTNKAAGELKERLSRMLGQEGEEVVAGTFHSFCARILRRECAYIGYSSHFTIYDTDDSKRLMKACMKELNIDEKTLGHKAILGEISRAKDELVTPAEYAAAHQNGYDLRLKLVSRAYTLYQKKLADADAMDFDDLLGKTVDLFTRFPEVLERYQRRFRYLMVDEYQDTNHAQYRLVSMLAAGSGNLCVVGDDDQSIYKFRGATIENILSFEEQFRNCRVIRLEQNYRSTGRILDAANAIIARNVGRKGKTLWTSNAEGDPLYLVTVDNAEEEGKYIAETILSGVSGGRRYSDFAVLYRANAQSNAIEQALVKSGIPYRIIGGHRFNDTLEVKDAMAYLRLLQNPGDEVSLRRVINQPKRGIGDTTVEHAAAIANGLGLPLYEVLKNAADYPDLSRAAAKIEKFIAMIEELRQQLDDPEIPLHTLYADMLDKTGYLRMWQNQGDAEAGRVENLEELSSSIRQYEKNAGDDYADLAGFLEEQALMTDIDNYDGDADAAVLMTMHSAKGLEFPVVLLPGFEDGIFPGYQTMFDPVELEEDRRLCYVAVTRAREQLYIVRAVSRMLYGKTNRYPPSRFMEDIPKSLTETVDRSHSYGGFGGEFGGSRYGERSGYGGYSDHSYGGYDRGGYSGYGGQQSRQNGGYTYPTAGSTTSRYTAGNRVTVGSTPKPAPKSVGCRFAVGDVVTHATFGTGKIVNMTAMSGDYLLVIDFDKAGQKKLMANYAKLEKQ